MWRFNNCRRGQAGVGRQAASTTRSDERSYYYDMTTIWMMAQGIVCMEY